MKRSALTHRPRWRHQVVALAAAGAAVWGLLAAVAGPAGAATPASTGASASDWTSAGGDDHDTHFAASETTIGPDNVASLQQKWAFTSGGSISATPTVVGGTVYVPDWKGNLYAVNASTGNAVWTQKISSYTGVAGDVSRNSPAYWQGALFLGDGALETPTASGAYIYGVNAATGAKLWSTQVEADPAAVITGSPVVHDGVVLVGVSSKAEALPSTTFRGSVVALDAATGKLLWQTYMVPKGYTGGAVWGSTPMVDEKNGLA